jgi:SRSO17 transposase
MISRTEQKITYPISLLLSNGKKTAESLSVVSGKSGDTILRMLDDKNVTPEELINIAISYFGTDFLDVIIDDSTIEKMYSKLIEGSGDNYDSSQGRMYRSLCTVVAMLSNRRFAIPVKHEFWINKEIVGDEYKTKVVIAKEIISFIKQFVRIRVIIADGLYATQEMTEWIDEQGLIYEMRLHSNRLIYNDNEKEKVKVRDYQPLKLDKSRRRKTVKCKWKGMTIYVTAIKRIDKKGNVTIVYQISNAKLSAREHANIYEYRWWVEIFFRTAKQSLGLSECQCRKSNRQKNHIYSVFLAYIFLQIERRTFHCKNPEDALRRLRRKSYRSIMRRLSSLDQIFRTLKGAYA